MYIFKIGTLFFYSLSTIFYFVYLFFPKNFTQRFGLIFLWIGFIFNLILIILFLKSDGFLICYNLSYLFLIISSAIAGAVIFLRYKYKLKIIGTSAMPIVTISGFISLIDSVPVEAKTSLLSNIWVFLHVILIFIGDAFFTIAFGMSILFLIQESSIKSKKTFFFFKRLPSLNSIHNATDFCIKSGFSFLTIGLIIGFVYAKIAWGKFWSWDPKELWSLISWLMYAFILHCFTPFSKVSKKKTAIIVILAFFLLIFTFLGVNFVIKGHHSKFIM